MSRYFKITMSGRFLLAIAKRGEFSGFGERLTVEEGVPQDGTLIGIRMGPPGPDFAELLYVSDEDGPELPEAVDIWQFADEITPTITVDEFSEGRKRELDAEYEGRE